MTTSRVDVGVCIEGACAAVRRRLDEWASAAGLDVLDIGIFTMHGNSAERWAVILRFYELAEHRTELVVSWGRGDAAAERYAAGLRAMAGERWQVCPVSVPFPQWGVTSGGQADATVTRPPEAIHGRNAEIVRLWREGLTYRQIGDQFGLAPKTIENRIGALRSRFGPERVPTRRSG